MSGENGLELYGVAAFIVRASNDVLTVEEQFKKRATNKLPKQRSIPMETKNPGESDRQALVRLFSEEIILSPAICPDNLDQNELCRFRPLGHIEVRTYLFEVSDLTVVFTGTEEEEVDNPLWEPISNLINHPLGSFLYRGGNRESAISYINSKRGVRCPEYYDPVIDRIPEEVFDRLEVIQNRELSPQNGLVRL